MKDPSGIKVTDDRVSLGCQGLRLFVSIGVGIASAMLLPLQAAAEDSVLVESRVATAEDAAAAVNVAAGQALEPVSQDGDHEPDLAAEALPMDPQSAVISDQDYFGEDSDEDDVAAFGAGLAEVAPPPQKSRRIASRDSGNARRQSEPRGNLLKTKVSKFNGIQPGTSTVNDVVNRWGEPVDIYDIDGGEVLVYEPESFAQVEVVGIGNTVDVVKVELHAEVPADQLAEQLRLQKTRPVEILDESRAILGVMFPERGVLFMTNATLDMDSTRSDEQSVRVSQIVIQTIDPLAFILRAEKHLHGPYESNIRDLEHALSIGPDSAHAHWLLADIYLATGQADLAELEASLACELEPENDTYRLRWARSLETIALYDEAVRETRAVLDGENTPDIVQARALNQMGRLAALGGIDVRSKAIAFHTKAISIADKLATSDDTKERRMAKDLLVDAHLAVAREVASQEYKNKVNSISQWLTRASGLAEEAIENEEASLELRLRVAEAALATLADIKPSKDPQPWVQEAEVSALNLLNAHEDTLWQRRVKWQLGVAYFHALRVEHTRRETERALKYGEKSIVNLAEGAKSRQAVPDSEHLVGRLYFHVGAIHAVHTGDHDQAVAWYDKAVPMLDSEVPVTELAVPRRHGESLVSMGVTYWQVGQRSRALELTQIGAELVEDAVAAGVLGKEALAVPYGNLSTMHRDLGNSDQSAKYADLAQAARKTRSTSPRPSTSRREQSPQTMVAGNQSSRSANQSGRRGMSQNMQGQRNASMANSNRRGSPRIASRQNNGQRNSANGQTQRNNSRRNTRTARNPSGNRGSRGFINNSSPRY